MIPSLFKTSVISEFQKFYKASTINSEIIFKMLFPEGQEIFHTKLNPNRQHASYKLGKSETDSTEMMS